ncbi:hypothetical protein GCM10010145_21290 [Streptomyces ruber]|uniref:Uncharacterized protein n=2 Tax=Streptomyces TaxID=1883 RepID=A0A918BA42_9ACTN|nr:hypothetical protein GCM10010145_21290 [Streptomyces ruber]
MHAGRFLSGGVFFRSRTGRNERSGRTGPCLTEDGVRGQQHAGRAGGQTGGQPQQAVPGEGQPVGGGDGLPGASAAANRSPSSRSRPGVSKNRSPGRQCAVR